MTQDSVRLLFDENIAPAIVSAIDGVLSLAEVDERAELKHVLAFQNEVGLPTQGVWDQNWIPAAASHGWSIIAGDRGSKGKGKGEKLPRLCVEHDITHFILGRRVHNRRMFKKLLTILSVWHEIISKAKSSPRGSRYVLEPVSMDDAAAGRGKLVHRPRPPDAPPPPGMLFEP